MSPPTTTNTTTTASNKKQKMEQQDETNNDKNNDDVKEESQSQQQNATSSNKNRKNHHHHKPERFWVDYLMEAPNESVARTIAEELCLEQTVELPGHTDAVQQVYDYVVGTIERIVPIPSTTNSTSSNNDLHKVYRVSVAYPNETAGNEMTQFLNVVFGNTSLKPGIAVENVVLSRTLADNHQMFPGPKFGIQGLRQLLGVEQAPLLCTALKPMGKSSQEFADMAYQLAKGGIDIIKDDHGLANQIWSPFEERVTLCAKAVSKANTETGRTCLYAPCLNAPANLVVKRAKFAKTAGAGAVMVLPGISGFDVVRELASDTEFNLPILIHPALLGGWIQLSHQHENTSNNHTNGTDDTHVGGLSHQFVFGVLPRLVGGDAVIFPNAGGRFSFSKEECQAVVDGCRRPMGRFEPILPSPAGGMKLHRVQEMRETFGDDTLFLIGGALLEEGPDLEEGAKKFVHSAGRDRPYIAPTKNH